MIGICSKSNFKTDPVVNFGDIGRLFLVCIARCGQEDDQEGDQYYLQVFHCVVVFLSAISKKIMKLANKNSNIVLKL